MRRSLCLFALACLAFPSPIRGDELTIKEIARGSIDDVSLLKNAPKNAAIGTTKELKELCTAWKIDVPKVDFAKHLVVVGTWPGSSFSAQVELKDTALTVRFMGSKDLRPGFRYFLATCPRTGVKKVNGTDLTND
jgi:hypothetical protein